MAITSSLVLFSVNNCVGLHNSYKIANFFELWKL